MDKFKMYGGSKVMKGSELFDLLESKDEKDAQKAAQLNKKLNAEMHARGELLPPHLQNFAIGAPRTAE